MADAPQHTHPDRRHAVLVRNLPFCVHEIDLDGHITSMNEGGLRMLGMEHESEIVGTKYLSAVAEDDRDRIAALLHKAFEGEASHFAFQVAGSTKVFSSCFIPLMGPDGRAEHVMGYTMDVTAARAQEGALRARLARAAQERMSLIDITRIDGFGEGGFLPSVQAILEIAARVLSVERLSLWRMDEQARFIECADLFQASSGVHEDGVRLARTDFPSYFDALSTGAPIDAHDARTDPRTCEFRESYLEPLGITSMLDQWVSVPGFFEGVICAEHVGPARIWNHDEIAFMAAVSAHVARVIYDTRQVKMQAEKAHLERQVLHAQKLESLGVLAGGIAHDFNNMLTTVLGNADLALQMLPEHSPARANIEEIEKGARHAAELATQMLAYSGRGSFITEDVAVNAFIEDMVHLLDVSISKYVVIRYDMSEDLPPITVDRAQFRQVIMNLVTNASEAIGDRSGIVSIRTGLVFCDDDCLNDEGMMAWQPAEARPGEAPFVYLEVTDTGCGMDEETLGRIFDPFFTTKFSGRGLGLAATLGIIKGHGGALRVRSKVGKGTTFRIMFPANMNPDASAEPEEVAAPGGVEYCGTVLVADDVDTVRALARQILERLGFDVIAAPDGREAVRLYREHAGSIRVVLLDLTMPHMGGEEAFRELRAINEDVRVILCSGFSEDDIEQRFLGKGLAGFLKKPFNSRDLRALLDAVLGSPGVPKEEVARDDIP